MADTHNEQVLSTISKLEDGIKNIIQGGGKWYSQLDQITKLIVPEVETIGNGWAGSEKKELAQQIIVETYWKFLDIKYIPNFIESLIVNKLASFLIDKAVEIFNKTGLFKHSTK